MHSLTPSFIFFPIAQDFAVKGVHRDGVLDTELKSTYDTARYKFLASLAQASGNLTVSAAVKEVAPGLTVGVSGTLPDVNTAKLAVDYVAPHVTLKTSTSLTAAPKVDAALTTAFSRTGRNIVAGADVSYDASKGSITRWAVGSGYTAADYQLAAVLKDNKDLSVLIAHNVQSDLTVGAEVVRNLDSAATSLSAAVQRRLSSGALQKVKVQHTGVVSVLHEQVLEGKSKITLSGQFDSKDLAKAPKYGVGLDLKY